MTGGRGDRHGRRLVDMSAPARQPEFLDQFDPEELTEERIDFDLGTSGRCIQKMLLWRNQVVWFSIVTQVLDRGRWSDVARADTCHDEAHVHRFVRGRHSEVQRTVIRQVRSIEEIGQGFNEACDYLLEQWTENVRRWASGG